MEQLMRDHPEWVYAAAHIADLWQVQPIEQGQYDSELAFELHLNRLKSEGVYLPELERPATLSDFFPGPKPKRKSHLFAAGFALTALFSILLFIKPFEKRAPTPLKANTFSEVSTRLGSKSKLVLPDSTVVWLNAGSKLTYNEDFGVDNRNTVLSGEAFFEVKKSSIPFIIETNAVKIKVLGTAFNVKSYPNEKTTETALIHGSVEITLNQRPGEKFILKPHEKLVVSNEPAQATAVREKKEPIVVLSSLTHSETDQSILETSWVENKLVFQNETFEELAKKLERWFNVSIEIKDEKLAAARLTGTFDNETVREALAALQISTPFRFTIEANHITILK